MSAIARSYSVRGLGFAAGATQELGARSVEVAVAGEVDPCQDVQPGVRPVSLGDGDRAVDLDHG